MSDVFMSAGTKEAIANAIVEKAKSDVSGDYREQNACCNCRYCQYDCTYKYGDLWFCTIEKPQLEDDDENRVMAHFICDRWKGWK